MFSVYCSRCCDVLSWCHDVFGVVLSVCCSRCKAYSHTAFGCQHVLAGLQYHLLLVMGGWWAFLANSILAVIFLVQCWVGTRILQNTEGGTPISWLRLKKCGHRRSLSYDSHSLSTDSHLCKMLCLLVLC
ncbi:hypothetical protein DM01DRAFT_1186715 [Hesseltinella vesiculosa]|uniref:Copper transporter n=1 Tax=Hesseltinella vesiculosa TaxID=101127 RepID=A0A1X2GQW4_9FUNG|nr:hypothetical protein DM01DRAFT_1186715 [Hesseltinella vesiculosa]